MVQWLRIYLPMKGTRVQSLFWGDPTCPRATKSVGYNYWACSLESSSNSYWSVCCNYRRPHALELRLRNKRNGLTWLSRKESFCRCRRCKSLGFGPGLERFPEVGNGYLFQYSCLENSMDRGALRAIVHRVAKSQIRLSDWAQTHTHTREAITMRSLCPTLE